MRYDACALMQDSVPPASPWLLGTTLGMGVADMGCGAPTPADLPPQCFTEAGAGFLPQRVLRMEVCTDECHLN